MTFYLPGSGYVQGSPFLWLINDFRLAEVLKSGIVIISRWLADDTAGRLRVIARERRIYYNVSKGEAHGKMADNPRGGATRQVSP